MHTALRLTALATIAAAPLAAQVGSVTADNTTYTLGALPSSTTSTSAANNFQADPAGGDQLFQDFWLYRVAGDASESAFNDSSGQAFTSFAGGSTGYVAWSDVDARGLFSAYLSFQAVGSGPSGISGAVSQRMRITNTSGAPLTISVFHYADLDVCGFGGNEASGSGRRQTVSNSSCSDTVEHFGAYIDAWEVASYQGLRDRLVDASADDLTSAGLPFAPGDFTGAVQWIDHEIAPGASETFTIGMAHNERACPFASRVYGQGSNGVSGTPYVFTAADPVIGSTATAVLRNAPPNSTGITLKGLVRDDLNFLCLNVLINPLFSATESLVTDSVGSARSSTMISNPTYELCGAPLFIQFFVLDPTSSCGFTHSNAVEWTIGRY